MPSRVLLSIGCDQYQHMQNLRGAELDASLIHCALTSGGLSCISEEDSTLLRSPNREQLTSTLVDLQDRYPDIESLTIFFAGHGGEANGSYFLCLKDSRADRLSMTGYALSHLFEFLNELKAAHCNIIIDACNAGGIVSNMNSLLRPEVIGKANTFGVSFFVSSALDQFATEDKSGGFGTSAILKVLKGEIDTGSRAKYLDLVDIGRPAAQHVAESTAGEQMPSVWGVNLYGHKPIFGNPHASDTSASSLLAITGISPSSPAGHAISEYSATLYSLMFAPNTELFPDKVFSTLSPCVQRLDAIPGASAVFIEGIWRSLEKNARNHINSFTPIELSATCISLLLASSNRDESSARCIEWLAHEIVDECNRVLRTIADALRERSMSLCRHGIPDFFYLPQRISRILGWSGASLHVARMLGLDEAEIKQSIQKISGQLVEHYAATCAGMSEAEAPFWSAFLTAFDEGEMSGLGELVVSTLYNALIENGGGLARVGLAEKEVYAYLVARASQDSESLRHLSSSPSELLAVTMLASVRHSLQDEVDFNLEKLDHVFLNIFIPTDYLDFSQPCIREGINNVFQVGHKIWTVDDLLNRWNTACLPQIQQSPSLNNITTKIGALCAALIFPDRVPWFLFIDIAIPKSAASEQPEKGEP